MYEEEWGQLQSLVANKLTDCGSSLLFERLQKYDSNHLHTLRRRHHGQLCQKLPTGPATPARQPADCQEQSRHDIVFDSHCTPSPCCGQTWAQFHRAAKHNKIAKHEISSLITTGLPANFNLLHSACYWYSAFVCLS